MSSESRPPEPKRDLPDKTWKHFTLYNGVREAIAALPLYFRTETNISGVIATDLHTLNAVLGATIEEQVVRTLNNLLRATWDPDGHYALYSFVRQPQTFPDVRLRKVSGEETIIGIELKSWYLLAKESEPSLRFQVTAAACAKQDLLVVVPWVLSNVISGSPILFEPFIESAKYAAEFRNYHWMHVRETKQDKTIEMPLNVEPYPFKIDKILDRPRSDSGGNFGRLARTGIMDKYFAKLDESLLCGIKIVFWRDFLKTFQENASDDKVRSALKRLREKVQNSMMFSSSKADSALAIANELEKLLDLLNEERSSKTED